MLVWCFTRTEVLSALQRQHRQGLLASESLRQAESRLQLAAALVARDNRPKGRIFVVRDDVLSEAARREGFHVLEPKRQI